MRKPHILPLKDFLVTDPNQKICPNATSVLPPYRICIVEIIENIYHSIDFRRLAPRKIDHTRSRPIIGCVRILASHVSFLLRLSGLVLRLILIKLTPKRIHFLGKPANMFFLTPIFAFHCQHFLSQLFDSLLHLLNISEYVVSFIAYARLLIDRVCRPASTGNRAL